MTTIQLNNLWTYLQSLSLSGRNKKWLADRLVESTQTKASPCTDETAYISSSPAMMDILRHGDEEIRNGEPQPIDLKDLWK